MSYKSLSQQNDNKQRSSILNQLVDVIQEDVSSSVSRRAYQVFVTGGVGPGVTSSLFQTVYDQDFTLQTANPIFDMTVGLYVSGAAVTGSSTGQDSAGKLLFPSQTLMMREKVGIYRQYASTLLGNASAPFYAPYGSTDVANRIDNAMFVSFKRLFTRDGIKRETFAIRMYKSGTDAVQMNKPNINLTSTGSSTIFTDIGASSNQLYVFGGEVGNIVNAANTSETVGLLFYDAGTAVFDMSKVFVADQRVSGVIDAMSSNSYLDAPAGKTIIGRAASGNANATFIPDFVVSASIDDIVDHIASARFQSGTLTAATFQNNTSINSSLYFCRVPPDDFNYSTNPTFVDGTGRIRVIDQGATTQRSFTMITTVGLHDDKGDLMAVAKLSRPIEKNDEKDVTFRIRLDF